MNLTPADRKLADAIARANPLERGRLGRIASGNHLAAQNDEPERNAHVHPLFAGVLAGIASAPADAAAIQRAAYVSLLAKHDWEFQFSDDHSVYQRGRDELKQLRMLQRELDPDHTLWNRHAPEGHRVGVAA